MTLQKALLTTLSTAVLLSFLLSPFFTSQAATNSRKKVFYAFLEIDKKISAGESQPGLNSPAKKSNKEKEADKKLDMPGQRRHADEDRHDNHHHHFDRIRSKRKIITTVMGIMLKIIVAASYFSILLCSYMSISH